MKDATFFAFVLGALGAMGLFHAIYTDEREHMHRELKNLQTKVRAYDPLSFSCPPGTVKIAQQADGGKWNGRCIGAGKIRVM